MLRHCFCRKEQQIINSIQGLAFISGDITAAGFLKEQLWQKILLPGVMRYSRL